MYVMGFDYGSQHLGLAIGQTVTATARPLATLPVTHQQPDWSQLQKWMQEWQPQVLVVGLPKLADGSHNHLIIAIHHFCQHLQQRYQLPVYTIDERLSSHAAFEQLQSTKRKTRACKKDAMAAKIILETWFAERNLNKNQPPLF